VLVGVRDFFRRQTVIELTGAVAVAWAAFSFLQVLFRGLVITPVTTAVPDFGGANFFGRGYFALGGRVFDWIDPLAGLVVLGLILGAVAGLLKATGRPSERPLRECPHCLEDIPAAAAVCSYCTRDVA
jgi:large conductance mechanosensitive channel